MYYVKKKVKAFVFVWFWRGFFVYVCAIETVQLEAAISFSCLTRAQRGQQGWIQEWVFTLKIIFGFQNILCCRLFLVLSQSTDYWFHVIHRLFYFEEQEVDCGGLQLVFSDLFWNHVFLIRFPSTVAFEFKNKMQASHETLAKFSTSNLFFHQSYRREKREWQAIRQITPVFYNSTPLIAPRKVQRGPHCKCYSQIHLNTPVDVDFMYKS